MDGSFSCVIWPVCVDGIVVIDVEIEKKKFLYRHFHTKDLRQALALLIEVTGYKDGSNLCQGKCVSDLLSKTRLCGWQSL